MKFSKFILKFSFFTFVSIVLVICGLYINAYLSPSIDLKTSGRLFIYDNSETLIYQGSTSSKWVDIDNINNYFINAIVSIEDKNFFNHIGFDYLRIISAAYSNISSGYISQGASTITQQYAKNMYLDFDQTWERKIEEAFLTLELEVHYSKDEILEGYVNAIYFGNGKYGVEAASLFYFNKNSSDLTLEEACILAGIPKSPNAYNPISDIEESIKRAKAVAKAMLDNEVISQSEYETLFIDDIEIYGIEESNNLQMLMYYQDAVLNELDSIKEVPKSLIESGGLKIYTTLDMNSQTKLEETILEYLPNSEVQVASVIIDPSNGGIMALSGGVNYASSTYNRALYSKRQVGSTMKSFLYYSALENNLTSASTFTSEHTVFHLSNDVIYSPSNYSGNYAEKDITMAAALAFSDNIYAVKTNLFLGVDKLIDVSRRVGITGHLDEVASLALGTSELNILDLSTGYTTFASGGYSRDLHFISKVEDMDGNVLYERKVKNELVLNPNYTYILNEMLAGTYNPVFVDYTTATALSFNHQLTNKYAIKSGSTDTDNWMVGYNEYYLMSIWMGYDDASNVGSNISSSLKNIWLNTTESISDGNKYNWYTKPDNVVGVVLDGVSGVYTSDAARSNIFYFEKGSEPNYITHVFEEDIIP